MMRKQYDITLCKSLRLNHIPSWKIQLSAASTSKFLPKIARFINKYLYWLGLGCSLNRYDNSITLYSSNADQKLYHGHSDSDIFCNFGSGAFFHRRWTNFDFPGKSIYYQALQGEENVDFYPIDLCAKDLWLPFNDSSVSLIYCSHTLEHLEERYANYFLAECYRVLKRRGTIRIVVPSTDNDHRIFSIIDRQTSIPEVAKRALAAQVGHHILSDTNKLTDEKIWNLLAEARYDPKKFYKEAVNAGVSNEFSPENPERHISFWDYDKLNKVAKELSFDSCVPFYRGGSLAKPFENLCVFDNTEPQASLYVELMK